MTLVECRHAHYLSNNVQLMAIQVCDIVRNGVSCHAWRQEETL